MTPTSNSFFVLSLMNFQTYEAYGFAKCPKLNQVKGLIEQEIKEKLLVEDSDLSMYTADGCLIDDS